MCRCLQRIQYFGRRPITDRILCNFITLFVLQFTFSYTTGNCLLLHIPAFHVIIFSKFSIFLRIKAEAIYPSAGLRNSANIIGQLKLQRAVFTKTTFLNFFFTMPGSFLYTRTNGILEVVLKTV